MFLENSWKHNDNVSQKLLIFSKITSLRILSSLFCGSLSSFITWASIMNVLKLSAKLSKLTLTNPRLQLQWKIFCCLNDFQIKGQGKLVCLQRHIHSFSFQISFFAWNVIKTLFLCIFGNSQFRFLPWHLKKVYSRNKIQKWRKTKNNDNELLWRMANWRRCFSNCLSRFSGNLKYASTQFVYRF